VAFLALGEFKRADGSRRTWQQATGVENYRFARVPAGSVSREFFLNIAFFISISETSINLQEFSKVGQRRSRRMRQQQVASGGCD
jgi:hypothetical protein